MRCPTVVTQEEDRHGSVILAQGEQSLILAWSLVDCSSVVELSWGA
jgi:hypothetical protein